MAEELLNGADIVTGIEKMGREGVPQSVAMRRLGNTARADGFAKRPLDHGLVQMMSPTLAGDAVEIRPGCRKRPLPPPLPVRRRVLGGQRARELDGPAPSRKIVIVQAAHGLQMNSQHSLERAGEHGYSIPIALASSYSDLVQPEIEILDPQAQPLEEPEPGPVQEPGNELVHSSHTPENRPHFVTREYDREAVGLLGPHQIRDPGDLVAEDFAVEKQQCGQSLVLGGRADSATDGEAGQKRGHLTAAQLCGVARAVKSHVTLDPAGVGLLRPATVMPHPQRRPHLPQELHTHTLRCEDSNDGTGFVRAYIKSTRVTTPRAPAEPSAAQG